MPTKIRNASTCKSYTGNATPENRMEISNNRRCRTKANLWHSTTPETETSYIELQR